jgi:hypothetical protein
MRCCVQFDWAFVQGSVLCTAEALQCGGLGGLRSLDHVGGPLHDAVLIGPKIAGIPILTLWGAAWFPILVRFDVVLGCFLSRPDALDALGVVAVRTNVALLIANCNTFVKKGHLYFHSSVDVFRPGPVMSDRPSGR